MCDTAAAAEEAAVVNGCRALPVRWSAASCEMECTERQLSAVLRTSWLC